MPRSALIVFGLLFGAFIAYFGMQYFDQQVAFFRGAQTFKAHYKSHEADYAALAAQFEKTPPAGQNDLCLAAPCTKSTGTSLSSRRREQMEVYPPLIQSLGFADGRFFRLTGDGEVVTMPLSWGSQEYYVNATLHYTGGDAPELPICDKPPTDGQGGRCALPLSDAWFVKYAWLTQSAFDPPEGTAEAECDSAKRQSFAAYSDCIQNSKAPKAKPRCDPNELSEDEFNKCVQNLIDRAQGF